MTNSYSLPHRPFSAALPHGLQPAGQGCNPHPLNLRLMHMANPVAGPDQVAIAPEVGSIKSERTLRWK